MYIYIYYVYTCIHVALTVQHIAFNSYPLYLYPYLPTPRPYPYHHPYILFKSPSLSSYILPSVDSSRAICAPDALRFAGGMTSSKLDQARIDPAAKYCVQCDGVFLSGASHGSRQKHDMRDPTMEEWVRKCRGEEPRRPRARTRRPVLPVAEAQGPRAELHQPRLRNPGEYTFKFGRHYGKPIKQILSRCPGYISWVVDKGIHTQRKHWHLLEALLAVGVLKKSDGSDGNAVGALALGPRYPKQRRMNWRRTQGPPRQPHHCTRCGSSQHNVLTCVEGDARVRASLLYAAAKAGRKRRKRPYSGLRPALATSDYAQSACQSETVLLKV